MWNVLWDDTLLVAFFEKSNCTQIVTTFFEKMGLLKVALEYSPWVHDYRYDVWMKRRRITLKDIQHMSIPKLKFIRNPYHRAMSMYTHFLNVPEATLPNLDKLPRPTLKQFLRALSEVQHKRGHVKAVNAHFTSQVMMGEKPGMWTEIIDVDSLRCSKQRRRLKRVYGLNFDESFTSSHWKYSDHQALEDESVIKLIEEIFPEDIKEFNEIRYT